MYVYIQSEPGLWTVGFYKPDGQWCAESDHAKVQDAVERVHYLNGGVDQRQLESAIGAAALLRGGF